MKTNFQVEKLATDRVALKKFMDDRKSKPKKTEEKIMNVIREGVRIGYMLSGQNMTNFDQRSLKMASPRFLGLMPDKASDDEAS